MQFSDLMLKEYKQRILKIHEQQEEEKSEFLFQLSKLICTKSFISVQHLSVFAELMPQEKINTETTYSCRNYRVKDMEEKRIETRFGGLFQLRCQRRQQRNVLRDQRKKSSKQRKSRSERAEHQRCRGWWVSLGSVAAIVSGTSERAASPQPQNVNETVGRVSEDCATCS